MESLDPDRIDLDLTGDPDAAGDPTRPDPE
jgi:hypothetical protein